MEGVLLFLYLVNKIFYFKKTVHKLCIYLLKKISFYSSVVIECAGDQVCW